MLEGDHVKMLRALPDAAIDAYFTD